MAVSSSNMSHNSFSCTFLHCVFPKTSDPASIFSNGHVSQQQTKTAVSLFDSRGDQHFALRGRLIGGFQVSGKSSCLSCSSKSHLWNRGTTLETGQTSLKTDKGFRVIVWRLSHPSAPRRAPVLHTCCFTRGARQLVAGNVHESRGRDVKEDLWENPGRDALDVSSCCSLLPTL